MLSCLLCAAPSPEGKQRALQRGPGRVCSAACSPAGSAHGMRGAAGCEPLPGGRGQPAEG